MRDLKLRDFAKELRADLKEQGVDVPLSVVYQMSMNFFDYIEKLMIKQLGDFYIHSRDITAVYRPLDVKKLCEEFAGGHGVSIDRLINFKSKKYRDNKMSRELTNFLRKRHWVTMDENALS